MAFGACLHPDLVRGQRPAGPGGSLHGRVPESSRIAIKIKPPETAARQRAVVEARVGELMRAAYAALGGHGRPDPVRQSTGLYI